MFSIRIHHGGKIRRYPGRMYVNGHVDIFDMVDIDLFTVIALNIMVVKLGYIGESKPLFYNNLRPLTSLDEGLYALAYEEDVNCLATLVRSFKLIEVYIEHGVTAVDSYTRLPPRFRATTIEEITDVSSSIEHRSKNMLLTWHDSSEPTKESVFDYVTPRSLPQHDSSTPCKDFVSKSVTPRCMPHCMLTPTTDEFVMTYTQLSSVHGVDTQDHVLLTIQSKFNDINLSFVSQQATPSQALVIVVGSGIESYGLSYDENFGVEDLDLNLNEPVDLNVSQIEIQAQLPVFEEPYVGRTQEPIMEEVRTQKPNVEEVRTQEDESAPSDGHFFYDVEGINTVYKSQYDVRSSEYAGADDDEDDDFLVDEENKIVEPDVDVHLFGISMDVPFDNIGVINLVSDDVLEGEDVNAINADGSDSDPGNDDETSNYRRIRLAELSMEMKGVINASGQ
ncbi:hypothetical protein Tco_0282045 [Tanacetum coccineum]